MSKPTELDEVLELFFNLAYSDYVALNKSQASADIKALIAECVPEKQTKVPEMADAFKTRRMWANEGYNRSTQDFLAAIREWLEVEDE